MDGEGWAGRGGSSWCARAWHDIVQQGLVRILLWHATARARDPSGSSDEHGVANPGNDRHQETFWRLPSPLRALRNLEWGGGVREAALARCQRLRAPMSAGLTGNGRRCSGMCPAHGLELAGCSSDLLDTTVEAYLSVLYRVIGRKSNQCRVSASRFLD